MLKEAADFHNHERSYLLLSQLASLRAETGKSWFIHLRIYDQIKKLKIPPNLWFIAESRSGRTGLSLTFNGLSKKKKY